MSSDRKWIVGSIIGTGGVIATLLLALAGLIVQQNASVNARIDDVNTRIDDVNTNVNTRIDDLRGEMNRRLDDMQGEIRELRTLITEALKRPEPAD